MGNYSTLGHKIKPSNSQDQYDTIANHCTTNSQKANLQYETLQTKNEDSVSKQYSKHFEHHSHPSERGKNYSEINISDHLDYRRELIPVKVDYSNVQVEVLPEDKTLNLDTLLIQLRPIAEKYKLIGSVAGISPVTVDKIEAHPAEPFDKLVEVCDSWLKKCRLDNIPPTWRAIANILHRIGQETLSCDILQVYKTGKLPISINMNDCHPHDAGQPSFIPPPPIPTHQDDSLKETDLEVAMMTVKSIKNLKKSSLRCIANEPPTKNETEEIPDAEIPPPIPRKQKKLPSYDCNIPPPQDKQLIPPNHLLRPNPEILESSHNPPPLPVKGKWKSSKKLQSPSAPSDKPPIKLPPKIPAKNSNPAKND